MLSSQLRWLNPSLVALADGMKVATTSPRPPEDDSAHQGRRAEAAAAPKPTSRSKAKQVVAAARVTKMDPSGSRLTAACDRINKEKRMSNDVCKGLLCGYAVR